MDAGACRTSLVCVCLGAALATPRVWSETVPCQPPHLDTHGLVRFVYDGDTIRVALPHMGDTAVRLAGIDAPEVAHGDGRGDPGAGAAHRELRQLLERRGRRVGLRFARERRDRYGRLLAHVYLADGTSVQAWLLRRGLAAHHARPPNLTQTACYRQANQSARRAARGMWGLARYRVRAVRELTARTTGYQRIGARVKRVGHSRGSVWLALAGGMAVRIDRDELVHFDRRRLAALVGRRIQIRGWVRRYRGQPYMRLRHPSALELAPQGANP